MQTVTIVSEIRGLVLYKENVVCLFILRRCQCYRETRSHQAELGASVHLGNNMRLPCVLNRLGAIYNCIILR